MGNQSLKHADKKNLKQRVVQSAAEVFCLLEVEKENLANKAGFSFCVDENFVQYFLKLLNASGKLYQEIYEKAQISEWMFYHIKSGANPTKTTLLALAISLEMDIDEIEILLKKAGYVLSESIALDMVVKWLIKHDEGKARKGNLIIYINYVLNDLGLPLLMAREKSPN